MTAGPPQSPQAPATPPGGEQPQVPPQPTLEQRVESQRAWLATLDRKLGVRTYALGAAVVLALAAGIVGVVLAVSAKDESATKDEVAALRDEVGAVEQSATEAAEEDVAALSERLDELEQRVNTLAGSQRTTESELSVVQDDIEDLRQQLAASAGGGGGGSTFDTGGGGAP